MSGQDNSSTPPSNKLPSSATPPPAHAVTARPDVQGEHDEDSQQDNFRIFNTLPRERLSRSEKDAITKRPVSSTGETTAANSPSEATKAEETTITSHTSALPLPEEIETGGQEGQVIEPPNSASMSPSKSTPKRRRIDLTDLPYDLNHPTNRKRTSAEETLRKYMDNNELDMIPEDEEILKPAIQPWHLKVGRKQPARHSIILFDLNKQKRLLLQQRQVKIRATPVYSSLELQMLMNPEQERIETRTEKTIKPLTYKQQEMKRIAEKNDFDPLTRPTSQRFQTFASGKPASVQAKVNSNLRVPQEAGLRRVGVVNPPAIKQNIAPAHKGLWITSQQVMGASILADNVLSDFAIKAGGKTIPCHRIYLAGRSPVLARLLQSKVTEAETGILTMEDMSAEGVEGFLKYLYTGSLVDPMADLSLALEMLRAGHKYEISDLEVLCKNILVSAESATFDATTAFEIYQFCGQVGGFQDLQEKAIRLLKENAVKFKKSGQIGTLFEAIQSAGDRKAFNDWICDGLHFA